MSNLADKTEIKALRVLAKAVKLFEALHYLEMTKADDWDATNARNLMEGIIESNGYRINYDSKLRTDLVKKNTSTIKTKHDDHFSR